MVGDYWGWYNSRSYHHTGMVSTWCGATRPRPPPAAHKALALIQGITL